MAGVYVILRQTLYTFFRNYHSFASIAALAVLPVSASTFAFQTFVPPTSPLLQTIGHRFRSLFVAAGCPVSSLFFSVLELKLSQTIFSFLFLLPFTLTLLLLAKASIIHTSFISRSSSSLVSSRRLYRSLLLTQICNSFAVLSANAVVFSLFFVTFTVADVLHLSSNVVLVLSVGAAVLYSVVLAHALVVCNLAVVVSGVENRGGYLPLLKAFLLVRSRAGTALSLAVPANLGLAAVEALFQYRIVKPYRSSTHGLRPSVAWEAFLIGYVHSLLVVLDVLGSCMFFKSYRNAPRNVGCDAEIPEHEDIYAGAGGFARSKRHQTP